jgi:NADH:ubiquinone oxidoreductase subunit 4 (subunit M)
LAAWFWLDPTGINYALDIPWVSEAGIHFAMSLDGISMLLVLLPTYWRRSLF